MTLEQRRALELIANDSGQAAEDRIAAQAALDADAPADPAPAVDEGDHF